MEMRKKKDVADDVIVFSNNIVKIAIEKNQEMFFEIKKEITTDLAEAVAIMINMDIEGLWNIELEHDYYNINPEKCLYWLSGGDREWDTMDHYKRPWTDYHYEFQEEFGYIVINIIRKSITLGDIRDNFIKHLNLPILYDFAVSKGFIK
jgi:hypothetical protein